MASLNGHRIMNFVSAHGLAHKCLSPQFFSGHRQALQHLRLDGLGVRVEASHTTSPGRVQEEPWILRALSNRSRFGFRTSLRPATVRVNKVNSGPPIQDSNGNPSQAIIWGILGLNGLVYLAWQKATSDAQSGDPSLYIWLKQNFTNDLRNLREGRIWTLLTCCFSHSGTGHIFMNAFTFYFLAPPVLQLLGARSFLALYLAGGIFSSFGSTWFHNVFAPRVNYSSHGASGAVYSVVSFLACVAPTMTFQLYGIIPVPAWLLVTGVFLWDGSNAVRGVSNGIDTAGHVAGILGGIGFFLAKRFRLF
ncbi:rhomboid-domain-containing protein [Trametopsis cervina]|nr:rhomboid-domain-containing protein [Trametopsis cervina]